MRWQRGAVSSPEYTAYDPGMKRSAGIALAATLVLLTACERPPHDTAPAVDPDSRAANATPDVVARLREKRDLPRHSADGGGRAWITRIEQGNPLAPSEFVVAGTRARISLRFEVGADGIAEGGRVEFELSPFWSWGKPQVVDRESVGFVAVTPSARDIELDIQERGQHALQVRANRALAAGETIDFVLGAGPKLAKVDRYAETESPIWFFVDGDGDGAAFEIARVPRLEVRAAAPARLVLSWPATAEPGAQVLLRAAVLDSFGNALHAIAEGESPGSVALELPPGIAGPRLLQLAADGTAEAEFRVLAAGVHRVLGEASVDGAEILFAVEAPPLVARPGIRSILWADLHGHSIFSDGTGTPEAYYRYAREIAGLDVAALTDHDHWGVSYLDERPEEWRRIRRAVAEAHTPGEFVALVGYEWTSWLHGHRHVLYFDDDGRSEAGAGMVHSFLDESTETPAQLWAALEGREALTFAHHSAGGPVADELGLPTGCAGRACDRDRFRARQ